MEINFTVHLPLTLTKKVFNARFDLVCGMWATNGTLISLVLFNMSSSGGE